MAWFLIKGRLSQKECISSEDGMGGIGLMKLGGLCVPLHPSGCVSEILWFDAAPNVSASLAVRKLRWVERVFRMAYRVFRTVSRLTRIQRARCQLRLLDVLLNLSQSYQYFSGFYRGISYSQWVDYADRLTDMDREYIRREQAIWPVSPNIRVWVIGQGTGKIEADEWLMLLQPGDQLAEHALVWFASEIRKYPDAALIYADDDEIEAGQRCRPRFKPDWSLAHLRSIDYIGRAVVINARALAAVGGVKPENLAGDTWELLLRVAEQAGDNVRHIPAVLLHRDAEAEKNSAVVIRHVRHMLPESVPLASIIIPTRDAVDLLRQCVNSVLSKTTYPRYEIVVVDNGSRDPTTLQYLSYIAQSPQVRVLRYDRPFNFSAINNFAAVQAMGEILCLLNNDTEVISPTWLEEMIGHLLCEKVGVVGAKLLYPDGRVQHAGDVVGPGGCADHLHHSIPGDAPGYCHRAVVAQELSAVTAACMITWRSLYQQLGGLDEARLPVAFNDVDYCLRVRRSGFKVVWTPHAQLYHHESVSRSRDKSWRRRYRAWRELRFMQKSWKEEMKNDPFYNPNFSYLRTDFVLSIVPNVQKPWTADL
jgi:GT2 family glycosyltransferase